MTPLFHPCRPCTGIGEHGAWHCQEMMGEIAPPPPNPRTGERQYCTSTRKRHNLRHQSLFLTAKCLGAALVWKEKF